MKQMASMTALRRLPLACILMGALASCGDSSAPAAPAPSGTTVDSLLTIVPAQDTSSPTTAQAGIALSRISNTKLGDLTLVLSNYLCQDPTGSGALLAHPARTGQLASYSLGKNEQSADAATVAMGGLAFQIPPTAAHVLVEVIDHGRNIALYGKLVAPAMLAGLKIALPETPLLASCAGPG
jgi:hypothetical protein